MWHRVMILAAVVGLLTCLATLPARGSDAATLTESIDRQIDARLETEKLNRVAPADDAEFLRRVYLDLHGVVPSAERAARFLDSRDREKRAQLIAANLWPETEK